MDKQMHWTYIIIIMILLTMAFPIVEKIINFIWWIIWIVVVPAGIIFTLCYEKTHKE